MPVYADLAPNEALAAARRDAAAGQEEAWDALDRYLGWHFLTYLQDRSGEVAQLREVLLEAADWARQEERSPWQYHWPYLLELLRAAERLPSTAGSLRALGGPEGRAAQILTLLADNEEPMRPGEVAERLGLSPQQVTNLGRELEEAGLIVRHKAKGRATWLFATPRGTDLVSRLPRDEGSRPWETALEYPYWPEGERVPLVH